MHCPRFFPLPLLLPLLVLAACGEDQSTAPTPPEGAASSAFSTASQKVVNSLADPGNGICNATQCTLREAINDPASTAISFASGLSGAITLARPSAGGGTLRIDKALTITGPSSGIVVRRRSTDPAFRIFRIGSGATVRLTNLIIRNGKTDLSGGGGGIINFGTLTLTHCTVAGNSPGGISSTRGIALTLTNSTVSGNSGNGISNGPGIALTIDHSTVTGNSGGGIGNGGGTLTLTHSTIAGNSGGGISDNFGTANLTDTRIVGNSGSGIHTFNGVITLTNSTVARNSTPRDGGGIALGQGGGVTLTNSTIAGNSATGSGGGISTHVDIRGGLSITLTNSTISGNSAAFGGGIDGDADAGAVIITLTNSTVTGNSATQGGGGITQGLDDDVLVLTNSLVAQNSAPTGPDLFGIVGSVHARFSLIGDGSGSGITNTDGNQVGNVPPYTAPIDPKLGPLALNGGPTRTHALLLGSPAIDAGSTADCPATDQRGVSRPQGAGCDIGSYERE
jgi:CSLREA domain-containing protein